MTNRQKGVREPFSQDCWAAWDVGGGGNGDNAGVLHNESELILVFSSSGKSTFVMEVLHCKKAYL